MTSCMFARGLIGVTGELKVRSVMSWTSAKLHGSGAGWSVPLIACTSWVPVWNRMGKSKPRHPANSWRHLWTLDRGMVLR